MRACGNEKWQRNGASVLLREFIRVCTELRAYRVQESNLLIVKILLLRDRYYERELEMEVVTDQQLAAKVLRGCISDTIGVLPTFLLYFCALAVTEELKI